MTPYLASALGLLLALSPMQSELDEGEGLLQAFKYSRAVSVLSKALARTDATSAERAKAYLLIGVAHFHMGEERQAVAAFREAVVLDESVELPELTSPKIAQAFERIKAASLPKVSQADPGRVANPSLVPEDDGKPRAGVPQLVVPGPVEPPPSRSYVPLVVGASVAAALLGTGAVLGLGAKGLESRAHEQAWGSDAEALYRQASGNATIANVFFGLAGASVVAGAVVTFAF